ncbi:retrovirus-related pol polyprotein from transposon TNT 1-94 [Tanacetum coccineum]
MWIMCFKLMTVMLFDSDVDEAPTARTMFMANLSSADPVYDKVGPSYDSDILSKNPLCLTHAKQVQPALYNGYEIIKNNHVPALVHNTEDTLEIAEITRRKMNDKMKDPECVTHKVKIAPPDYSKENYLATFTPQKQLTPEQIFWSQDLIKMKEKALKEQTTASRPIKALTVYPPNTPATLVPRVLPTKSQVKINIFTLIQLFSEFEKTCKKIITPTRLTKRERGFEQTKECYLTEVIPFFKTLKEHFEGIQKALTKEIKEMKDIFEELEAEVDQNVVNRKHDEIERKKLLIANDNLIADCLSKEVFYIAMNSELTVSRFTKIHKAHTIVQTRCLKLEAELFKLQDKLKYQNLKESFGNNPSPPARDTPDFDSVFTRSEADRTLDFRTLDFQITQLTEKVSVLQEQNELFRAENEKEHYLKHLKESVETLHKIVEEAKVERPFDRSLASAYLYTKHSQELILICELALVRNDFNTTQFKKLATTTLIRKKARVNCCTNARGSQPRNNTKKNRISPAKRVNNKKVEEYPRTNKSKLRTTNHVDYSSSSKRTVVQIVLWYLDSGCSKHMTGDRSRLRNFVKKFIGTVRFGNDHFGAIMGYGDYVIVAFRKHSCYVRDTDGVELIKGSRGSNLYTISVEDMMKSSPICLLSKASKNKSWLWHRRLNHLNFGTINDLARKDLVRGLPRLKFEKDHLCSACQLGKSKKHTHKPKTENTNLEVLNTLHMDLWLVPNPVPAAPYVPPTNKELEILFQPMLDEYLELTRVERPVSPAPAVFVLVTSAGTPSSTTIDQDAPSPSHSLSFHSRHYDLPIYEAFIIWDLSIAESPYVSHTLHHLGKWSKGHPLDNIIGNLSRPVYTRKQQVIDALWCLYNSVLSKVKPKNFKSAITEDCWFQAMQDEIHEFDRLQVWELVPQPDCVMIIALKWIYKVKLDEYGDVLKNKARLVAKGY